MTRFAALTLVLMLFFSLLMSAALLIGRAQPTPERIERLHLTDCALALLERHHSQGEFAR